MHVDNYMENYCGYVATELGAHNLYRKQCAHTFFRLQKPLPKISQLNSLEYSTDYKLKV